MSLKYKTVEINLAVVSGGELPVPGKPCVVIDGMEFPEVESVSLSAESEGLTFVTMTFPANVAGAKRGIDHDTVKHMLDDVRAQATKSAHKYYEEREMDFERRVMRVVNKMKAGFRGAFAD